MTIVCRIGTEPKSRSAIGIMPISIGEAGTDAPDAAE